MCALRRVKDLPESLGRSLSSRNTARKISTLQLCLTAPSGIVKHTPASRDTMTHLRSADDVVYDVSKTATNGTCQRAVRRLHTRHTVCVFCDEPSLLCVSMQSQS